MSKNKITFIIPSLNRDSLTKSIQSLIDQTNPNWECIIIYDGVDGITFDDDRIKTIKIKKTGTIGPVHGQSGLVRNEGIKKVNTEWIGFLDDDDTLHPDYVNTLYEKYSNYDFVIWRMVLNDGRVIPGHNNNNNIIFGDVGISFCYKNKFNDLLFNTNRDGEDFDFLIKLKSLTNNFITTPEVYYNVNF
jgi:glycosyltransferase involved in cell wall biosynthesis